MTNKSFGIIRRGIALSLMAATTLHPAHPYYAHPTWTAQASADQSSSDLPDVKAMVDRANKMRMEGELDAAAAIWRQILIIIEREVGQDHLYVAISLNNLGEVLRQQGHHNAAETLYRRSLAIHESLLGPDHPYVATSLNNLAGLLWAHGQYSAAEPLLRRSLTIREKTLGPDHPDVATSLNNLAELLRKRAQYAEAEPLYRRAIAINEKTLGSGNPAITTSLNNLGGLLMDLGSYAEAERLYRRSLATNESTLGLDHPQVGVGLNNLAEALRKQGNYIAAKAIYRRSVAVYEKALGANHPDTATPLSNLAELLSDEGQYNAAELLMRRSLAIREKSLGPDHPDVATSLNNLAQLLRKRAQYAKAKTLYSRCLAIQEKALGPNHPFVATSLNNLGGLLEEQGQYAEAESLYRRSLSILEKAKGANHPDVATLLNNIAGALINQRSYAAAEHLYRRSLAIYENTFGANHPYVALSLNNLGALLGDQGQYERAEIAIRRSLTILEKAKGANHPDVATSLWRLAELLMAQDKYAGIELFYRRSRAIREKALGPDHPTVAVSLDGLAELLMRQEQYSSMLPHLHRSASIESTWLLQELPLLPDQARPAQLQHLGSSWTLTFGVISNYPSIAKLALEMRLNRQGLLPEIERRQALMLNASGVDHAKVEQLQVLTRQLSSITLPSDRRAEVREQRNKLQSDIYRQIPELQIPLITTAEVAKALPADGALVEFQRYQPFDGGKPKDQRWGEAQYIALVLNPDASVTPVQLGSAAAIDAKVHQALRATADGLSDADAIWGELSDQVLKPLLPHLTGSRQWFLSPDGELNRVPFAALPAPQQPGTRLAQIVQLRLLTTGRELVKLQQPTPTGSGSLVVANPNYDRLDAKPAQKSKAAEMTTVAQQRSAELGSNKWKQLPASEREGQKVAKLLSTGLISGTSATTKALQRHQGPRVLHVATHGFFVADQETKPTEPMRAIQEGSPLLHSLRQEDPQLRSGLVFAGANQPDLDPNDDGYLTAAEAVNLNLKGTELVVLSACSTGQGEVRTGEGVYGLQRSLTVAGARSTLLSLWKVDDAATAEFMSRFYQRLKAGEGRSDALAAVQEEFRSGKVQSANGVNWKEPYYWAAWQLVGDWKPIPGL
jgi:CHAT domain-containing protein/tetratricopeptide (TPR) repeat protein